MHIDVQHCWTTLKSSPKIASIKTYFYAYCKPSFIRYNFYFINHQINKLVHSDLFFMTKPYSHSCCYFTNTCTVRIHHDEAVVNFAKNFWHSKKKFTVQQTSFSLLTVSFCLDFVNYLHVWCWLEWTRISLRIWFG